MTEEQYAAARKRGAKASPAIQQARKPAAIEPRRGLGLRLPFPPTVNHSTRPTARGGRILTAAHKAFRAEVARIVAAEGGPHLMGRLAMDITVCPPNRRRFDLDNRIKSLLDALQHAGVYADDEQIDDLRIRRGAGGGNDSFVTITRLTATTQKD